MPLSQVLQSNDLFQAAMGRNPGLVESLPQLLSCAQELGRASTWPEFSETLRALTAKVLAPDATWVLLPCETGSRVLRYSGLTEVRTSVAGPAYRPGACKW